MIDTLQTQSTRRWLITILLVSILLRVAAAFYLGDTVGPMPGTYDQVSYDRLAQRLLAGYGFTFDKLWWPYTQPGEPTAHWSFLYTLYLTGIYGLVGYQPLIARVLQAVLVGALMPWLVYRLGSRHFGSRVGLVASGIMACYAYFVYYAGTLMTENFYIIGILWVLDIAGQLGQEGDNLPALRHPGLVLGLALGFGLAEAFGLEGAAYGVVVIQGAMPIAVLNYLLAARFGRMPDFVASLVVLSTLLSFAAVPVVLALLL